MQTSHVNVCKSQTYLRQRFASKLQTLQTFCGQYVCERKSSHAPAHGIAARSLRCLQLRRKINNNNNRLQCAYIGAGCLHRQGGLLSAEHLRTCLKHSHRLRVSSDRHRRYQASNSAECNYRTSNNLCRERRYRRIPAANAYAS